MNAQYCRVFDRLCYAWTTDPEMNLLYLKTTQRYFTDKLKYQGYLFLNDVLERLGYNREKDLENIGWFYDEEKPFGDNFVDFGLYSSERIDSRDFINCKSPDVLLYFNVDGDIGNILLDMKLDNIKEAFDKPEIIYSLLK